MKKLRQLKVLIVGLGQIGGAIGLDLVEKRLVAEVIGFDIDATITDIAKRRRAIDRSTHSLTEGLAQADLVILAAPIRRIIETIPQVRYSANENIAILDVAGTKMEILRTVAEQYPRADYVSGHPLIGTEKCGLQAALSGMFKNTTFVLVPAKGARNESLGTIRRVVEGLGATPLIMKADEHDRLIALTSNLPYLFALSLTNLAMKYAKKHRSIWNLIGGSFRSATRVAASSPELTLDMFMTNRREIPTIIDEVIAEFTSLKEMIEREDETALKALIRKVRKKSEVLGNG